MAPEPPPSRVPARPYFRSEAGFGAIVGRVLVPPPWGFTGGRDRARRRAIVFPKNDTALCITTSVLIRPARRADAEGFERAASIALDVSSEGMSGGPALSPAS